MKNQQRVADSNFDRIQARNGLGAKNQSQMSKLIPMLVLGATGVKEAWKVIEGLEKRINQLEFLKSSSTEAFRRLPTMADVSRERQMKRLGDALKAVEGYRAVGLPQGTSKALKAVKNELTCLREISYLGELDEESLDLSAIAAWYKTLDQCIATSKDKLAEQRPLLEATAVDDVDGPSESELKDPVFSASIVDVINSTKATDTLPALGDAPFTIGRTSVIPVPAQGISEDLLRKRGFDFQNLGGYYVLRNQLVLTVREGTTVEEATKELRKATKHSYMTVSASTRRKDGSAWYWLMREPELDDFTSAFPGKSLQLRNWGFC